MKKVLDTAIEANIKGMSPAEVVAYLKTIQDASGIKICRNVTPGDPAYLEV